jgi:DNA-binding MarR family transcriptional regulator
VELIAPPNAAARRLNTVSIHSAVTKQTLTATKSRRNVTKIMKKRHAAESSVIHLIHRAAQVAAEAFRSELGDVDMTLSQYAVLAAVKQLGAPSQTQITKITGIDRSTLGDLVTRLSGRRLIVAYDDPRDGRATVIRLTTGGRHALAQAGKVYARVETTLLEVLPEPRRCDFLSTMQRLVVSWSSARKVE